VQNSVQKIKVDQKQAKEVAQVIECLPKKCLHKALSSNPSVTKKEKVISWYHNQHLTYFYVTLSPIR
jgi:hypothetical protein